MQFLHDAGSLRNPKERVRYREDEHRPQRQQHSRADFFVKQALEESGVSDTPGVCQCQQHADHHLQLEVHGPDGGLEDAELGSRESLLGCDVGEEGLVDLCSEEEGKAVGRAPLVAIRLEKRGQGKFCVTDREK